MNDASSYEMGRMVGYALTPILVILGSVWLGRHLGKRKNPPGFVSWPVIVAIILVVVALVAPRQSRAAEVVSEGIHGR